MSTVVTCSTSRAQTLARDFVDPPDAARPGVYWYFMDGNLDREEMVRDLESMKAAGLGNLVFLEVDVGVPRGPVKFMSDEWQGLFANVVHHAERLGIDITLGAGPGWTGSGGPWVKPEQSMQHLVFSTVETKGPARFDGVLPVPEQRSTPWHRMRSPFYEDVVVYAFPKCPPTIADINEKALYERDPYTSKPGVKPWLPSPADAAPTDPANAIDPAKLIDLTDRLQADGRLTWDVPAGKWTLLRMGRRSTGASTRPAPAPGVGFDHDKLDATALDEHFNHYYGKLLEKVGPRADRHGWTAVHLDSWEMGAQNWTPRLLTEFRSRRGYDARPYLATFSGRAVTSVERSERFLWDMRLTLQELVLQNYAGHLKTLGHRHGFELSIEPYDMNPTADLDLGAVADVPMCEFWSAGFGFDSSFSCIEATSVAHVMGRSIVSSEAFTAGGGEKWQQYPWSMKNQGDWAFCMGVNRFVYHTFAHKALGEAYRPGMTMGPYGVHWDRGQTWWPMVGAYHKYVTRCSHLLRQGVAVSDVLYLTPEGAPQVFRAPASALNGSGPLADKKGYGFDGCSPNMLMAHALVRDGHIAFPNGTSYRLLVLPRVPTMTPALLKTLVSLVEAGAVIYGAPPVASPSLSGYPQCDEQVRQLARELWGEAPVAARTVGKGCVMLDAGANRARRLDTVNDTYRLANVANWIWFDQGNPAHDAPPGDVHFRYELALDDVHALESATIEATADNAFSLSVNGKEQLAGDNWQQVGEAELLSALRTGKNTIEAVARNASSSERNPAGFIAAIRLKTAAGTKMIATGHTWQASLDARHWTPAKTLGPASMSPWGLKTTRPTPTPTGLYPDYATTASVLRDMEIPEDFVSDGPIRYGHRLTANEDIYFIANTADHNVHATCTFRVRRGAPQLWNPVTAEMRRLPRFTRQNKTTSVPFVFEPYQSFFVIFPHDAPAQPVAADGANFPTNVVLATLDGPWTVEFDPKWGGPSLAVPTEGNPGRTTFTELIDWTRHPARGIKYYSGIATYRKRFERPADADAPGAAIFLELGTVHDIARVRLNGKELGVLWCAPWRVDITDAVRPGANVLEIDVANRWPNRLYGDQQPPDKGVRTVQWTSGLLGGKTFKTGRYTFTTGDRSGLLLPSGLLGPVKLLRQPQVPALQTP